jgi:hypothetical protein
MLNKLVASDCGSDISEDFDKTKKNIRKKLYEEARHEALEKTVQSAIQETVNSGADRETVTILDKSALCPLFRLDPTDHFHLPIENPPK